MQLHRTALIKTFTDRYPFVGPVFWMVSVQYYVIQVIVAHAWKTPYSWLHNTISDLGNTACGVSTSRYACSPLHSLMNASFIVLGITMISGSILIYREFKKSRLSTLGFSFMAFAGVGSILVGLFPENTISSLHILGASLPFLIGNLGIVIMGSVLDIPKSLKVYSLLSGLIPLVALAFFITHNYLGLDIGGLERVVAYPQTMWLIVFGIYISSNHLRARATH